MIKPQVVIQIYEPHGFWLEYNKREHQIGFFYYEEFRDCYDMALKKSKILLYRERRNLSIS